MEEEREETTRVWRMCCAGFRHTVGFHARVVLDGVASRLGELGGAVMYKVFLE